MKALDKFLPPELREDSGSHNRNQADGEALAQGREMTQILRFARKSHGNPLPFMGFQENRWPAVYALLSLLLDAADSLRHARVSRQPLSSFDWGSADGHSFYEITSRDANAGTLKPVLAQVNRDSAPLIDFDTLTDRPFADELTGMLVSQVFICLGEIIFSAADYSPEKQQPAMSCVFRILARLHHSDFIPDRVYRYSPPHKNETTFRPPGMHLLATHIMRILSDAAWADHEAEIAKGEESPFVPFKMGSRELGPEIWLEFVLWCCVENGFFDIVGLLHRLVSRRGDNRWHLRSWKPFLQNPEAVWNTNIDSEEFWRLPGDESNDPSSAQSGSTAFHGLGKRTISSEVVASVVASMLNNAYTGMGWRGPRPLQVLFSTKRISRFVAEGTEDKHEPTTKVLNEFAVRFIESGIMDASLDPHTFQEFLSYYPHVVPPWDNSQLDVEELGRLSQSQIHDETSAFTGLMEYNIQRFAVQSKNDLALKAFNNLLHVVDESKRQHIMKSFELLSRPETGSVPTFNANYSSTQEGPKSCIPQMSNVALARLLDSARASQDFAFADWLLSSDDIDGPAIPPSLYGDQALSPPLIRYAMATGNKELHEQVVRSLVQPLSLNTLRFLLNAIIAMGEWDNVVELFSLIRDHRAKSWGFSNVATLAIVILRLDHSIQHSRNIGQEPLPETCESLNRAKDVLDRVLKGEFNTPQHISADNYYDLAIYGFGQMLKSIAGPFVDITKGMHARKLNPSMGEVLPNLPTEPFNELLSAVVELHGSAAGKFLWSQWLISLPTIENRRRHQGGVKRLYQKRERRFDKGHPTFDSKWFHGYQQKMVYPNLNTVHILARKAVQEFTAEPKIRDSPTEEQEPSLGKPVSQGSDTPAITSHETPEGVLDFCVLRYKSMDLSNEEIDIETNGHLTRMLNEGKLFRVPQRGTSGRVGYSPKWLT